MVIYMAAWLDGCMKHDSKRYSKCIYTIRPGFNTCNHTIMHSCPGKVGVGIIIR